MNDPHPTTPDDRPVAPAPSDRPRRRRRIFAVLGHCIRSLLLVLCVVLIVGQIVTIWRTDWLQVRFTRDDPPGMDTRHGQVRRTRIAEAWWHRGWISVAVIDDKWRIDAGASGPLRPVREGWSIGHSESPSAWAFGDAPSTFGWRWLGIIVRPIDGFHAVPGLTYRVRGIVLSVSIWPLILLTAAWPVLRFVRRRGHRYGPGRCPTCGYDLRASPDRCPECGTPVAAAEPPSRPA